MPVTVVRRLGYDTSIVTTTALSAITTRRAAEPLPSAE
jgi:hypothetical protein